MSELGILRWKRVPWGYLRINALNWNLLLCSDLSFPLASNIGYSKSVSFSCSGNLSHWVDHFWLVVHFHVLLLYCSNTLIYILSHFGTRNLRTLINKCKLKVSEIENLQLECFLSNNHVDQTILPIHKFIHIEQIKETHVLVVTASTYYLSLCKWRVVRDLTSITLSDYAFLLSNLLLQQNMRAHNTKIQDHNVNHPSNMGQDVLNWYSTANSAIQKGQNNTILRRV